MSLPQPLSKLVALLPGPIVAWVNSFTDLLKGTILGYYEWQDAADTTAVYVVVVAVMVIGLTSANLRSGRLRAISWFLGGIAGVALVTCVISRYLVSAPDDGARIVLLRDFVWQYSYIALIVFSMLSLTFAILSFWSDRTPT